MPAKFEPASAPLHGPMFIEASAGTGKTYSITLLVLRMLLERGLDLASLLVVTYTNAARDELRDRIRARLREALTAIDHPQDADSLVLEIVHSVDGQSARSLLRDALLNLDQAAVFTIHGFCQRMLAQHALASGAPFSIDFLEDDTQLIRMLVTDFWRREFSQLDAAAMGRVLACWPSPESLYESIRDALRHPLLCRLPDGPRADRQAVDDRQLEAFRGLQRAWASHGNDIRGLTDDSRLFKKNSRYLPDKWAAACDEMESWLAGREPAYPLPAVGELFIPAKLAASVYKGRNPPDQNFFSLYDAFQSAMEDSQRGFFQDVSIRCHDDVVARLPRLKDRLGQWSFDDQLRRLDLALSAADGRLLARRIRDAFPVALIDEFQDTDPLQYRIFNATHNHRDATLCLIGDPKQAIYSFRGGDVFTYWRARSAVPEERRRTLAVNYRSSVAVMAAVNALFSRAGALHVPVFEYSPVAAAARADERLLMLDGVAQPGITVMLYPSVVPGRIPGKPQARDWAATVNARSIAQLVRLAAAGQAQVDGQALRPADIAVLVRNRGQGELMRAALAEHGIASVSLSRDSVFQSAAAEHMARLMDAIMSPGDETRLRVFLLDRPLGWTATQVETLTDSEWSQWHLRLADALALWRRSGFMTMFRYVLTTTGLAERVAGLPRGERLLTDLLHLAELLQAAGRLRGGPHNLRRWFETQRDDPAEGSDATQLRLESDRDLVRIVTMHKAKGLEFPVVYAPFTWDARRFNPGRSVLFHRQPEMDLCWDLGSDEFSAHRSVAEREQFAEELRLLYVALTRAKSTVVLTWGRFKDAQMSPLAHLLHRLPFGNPSDYKAMDDDTLRQTWIAAGLDDASVLRVADDAWPTPGAAGRSSEQPTTDLACAIARRHIQPSYALTSYSRLARGAHTEHQGRDYDWDVDKGAVDQLPRGPLVGRMLHAILEKEEFATYCDEDFPARVVEYLRRFGLAESFSEQVAALLRNCVQTPVEAGGFCLQAVAKPDRLTELEFYFPISDLDVARLHARVAGYSGGNPGAHSERLAPGLMRGFIDLVVRHEQRFYIADYKSNYIGMAATDYHRAALDREMLDHDYNLQYLIYTLAMHRYLQSRIPDYAYDTHFGGVYYLFLRGMTPGTGPGYGIWRDRPPLSLINDLEALVCGGGHG